MKQTKILIYDNDREHNELLKKTATQKIQINYAVNRDSLYGLINQEFWDAVVLADKIYDIEIEELIIYFKQNNIKTKIIYFSESYKLDDIIKKIKSGYYYYFVKPVDVELFTKIVNEIKTKLKEETNQTKNEKRYEQTEIIGKSKIITRIRSQIKECSENSLNVLITGPTGSGKDLVAYNIYKKSILLNQNYIKIDCGLLPHNLIDNELFGHHRGAYTGAYYSQKGLFESASNGTIYIDGIDNIPYDIQSKFLSVLATKSFYKIGAEKPVKINSRFIISALEGNNNESKENIKIRDDLFYRIKNISIKTPYLREHLEDIDLLAEYFNEYYAKKYNTKKLSILKKHINILYKHKWEGNVRELENLIQKMVLTGKISEKILKNELTKNIRKTRYKFIRPGMSISELENELIIKTYEFTGNSIKSSAELLEITPKTLSYKLKKINNIE